MNQVIGEIHSDLCIFHFQDITIISFTVFHNARIKVILLTSAHQRKCITTSLTAGSKRIFNVVIISIFIRSTAFPCIRGKVTLPAKKGKHSSIAREKLQERETKEIHSRTVSTFKTKARNPQHNESGLTRHHHHHNNAHTQEDIHTLVLRHSLEIGVELGALVAQIAALGAACDGAVRARGGAALARPREQCLGARRHGRHRESSIIAAFASVMVGRSGGGSNGGNDIVLRNVLFLHEV